MSRNQDCINNFLDDYYHEFRKTMKERRGRYGGRRTDSRRHNNMSFQHRPPGSRNSRRSYDTRNDIPPHGYHNNDINMGMEFSYPPPPFNPNIPPPIFPQHPPVAQYPAHPLPPPMIVPITHPPLPVSMPLVGPPLPSSPPPMPPPLPLPPLPPCHPPSPPPPPGTGVIILPTNHYNSDAEESGVDDDDDDNFEGKNSISNDRERTEITSATSNTTINCHMSDSNSKSNLKHSFRTQDAVRDCEAVPVISNGQNINATPQFEKGSESRVENKKYSEHEEIKTCKLGSQNPSPEIFSPDCAIKLKVPQFSDTGQNISVVKSCSGDHDSLDVELKERASSNVGTFSSEFSCSKLPDLDKKLQISDIMRQNKFPVENQNALCFSEHATPDFSDHEKEMGMSVTSFESEADDDNDSCNPNSPDFLSHYPGQPLSPPPSPFLSREIYLKWHEVWVQQVEDEEMEAQRNYLQRELEKHDRRKHSMGRKHRKEKKIRRRLKGYGENMMADKKKDKSNTLHSSQNKAPSQVQHVSALNSTVNSVMKTLLNDLTESLKKELSRRLLEDAVAELHDKFDDRNRMIAK